ncbi:CHIA chitinase, partial [Polypterus senegalus]|nr:CHIA chitinase [Polypterus senegalus]
GATQVWNSAQNVPYAYNGNLWVGYDNEKSFQNKANWLMQNNFGGAMVWTLHLNDFSGTFCNQGRYPLINTLKSTLGVNTSGMFMQCSPLYCISSGGSGSGGSSSGSGGSGFCAGKANGFYPDASNENRFWNCMNGVTYSENCAAGLVYDANCSCCNWP